MESSVKDTVWMPTAPRITLSFYMSQTHPNTNITDHKNIPQTSKQKVWVCLNSLLTSKNPQDHPEFKKNITSPCLLPPTERPNPRSSLFGRHELPISACCEIGDFVGNMREGFWLVGDLRLRSRQVQAKWEFVSTQPPRLWGNSACLSLLIDGSRMLLNCSALRILLSRLLTT